MGWGDDLMWLGEANKVHEENHGAVIHDGREYSELWKHASWVVPPTYNGPEPKILVPRKPGGNRWYIQGWGNGKVLYKKYDPIPAPYEVLQEERDWACNALRETGVEGTFVLINPDTKNTTFANNKQWGLKRWNELCELLHDRGITCLRTKPPGAVRDVSGYVEYKVPELERCVNITTPSIRHAFAIMEQSLAVVTSEGGLHHAAAALDKKAFVIFGGVSSVESTGYRNSDQVYYTYDHPMTPCGSQTNCQHCKEAMASIKPSTIAIDVFEFVKDCETLRGQ